MFIIVEEEEAITEITKQTKRNLYLYCKLFKIHFNKGMLIPLQPNEDYNKILGIVTIEV